MWLSLDQEHDIDYWDASMSGVQQTCHGVCNDDVLKSSSILDHVKGLDMFCQPQQHCAGLDLTAMIPEFEEDAELAAARDVVTADLKCLHDASIPSACSPLPQPQSVGVHLDPFKTQKASGVPDSSCGAPSPQASCDTAAAQAQQVLTAQQYDAAFGLVLAHSPSQYPSPSLFNAYGSSCSGYCMPGAPCAGLYCYPSQHLHPQASSSSLGAFAGANVAPATHSHYAYADQHSTHAVLSYAGLFSTPEAPLMPELTDPPAGGMVPYTAFGHSSSARCGMPLISLPHAASGDPSAPAAGSMVPYAAFGHISSATCGILLNSSAQLANGNPSYPPPGSMVPNTAFGRSSSAMFGTPLNSSAPSASADPSVVPTMAHQQQTQQQQQPLSVVPIMQHTQRTSGAYPTVQHTEPTLQHTEPTEPTMQHSQRVSGAYPTVQHTKPTEPTEPTMQHTEPTMQRTQRVPGAYPMVHGGVQKKGASPAQSVRMSTHGSCSSQDVNPTAFLRPKKAIAHLASSRAAAVAGSATLVAAAAGTAAAGAANKATRQKAARKQEAAAASGSASSSIRQLRQEIEVLAASKVELKTQLRKLLTSQSNLLTHVSTLTAKLQKAVAENANLHRQNLQLAACQGA